MLNYRSFVGYEDKFDIIGAMQFNLLTSIGLREHHKLLDIGCGSLRAGRLFIPYLNSGNYFGIEPEKWLVAEGIRNELGLDILKIKNPKFIYEYDFPIFQFGEVFDFMLAHSIFTHAHKGQISQCFKNVHSCLTEYGLFVATFVAGDLDYEGNEWVYPTNCTYTEKTINHMAQNEGLSLVKSIMPCDEVGQSSHFSTSIHPSNHPSKQTWAIFAHDSNIANTIVFNI